MQLTKRYFQGLNALRFFAAFLVVLTHAERIREKNGLFHLREFSVFNDGGLAVQFFFVLSGFLITYLLLQERQQTSTIHIPKFYMRRVLRIWPLYYLLVAVGLVVPLLLPHLGIVYQAPYPLANAGALYLVFLPNLVNALYGTSLIYMLWSIGVEEQFYLIWAPIVRYAHRYLILIFCFIILFKLGINYYLQTYYSNHWVTKLVETLQFECMAIGGLGAYWIFNGYKGMVAEKSKSWAFLFSKTSQWCFLLLTMVLLFFAKTVYHFDNFIGESYRFLFSGALANLFTSLLFLYLILNTALNPKQIWNTEHPFLNFLGEISYGLYMYHTILLFFLIAIFKKYLMLLPPFQSTCLFYGVLCPLLTLVCWVSYQYFERWFLKWKFKWE